MKKENEPADSLRQLLELEACCPTTVLRIPRAYFDGLLRRSHEFALWVMSAHQNQLFYNECRNQVLSGDAKSRLLQLTQRLSGLVDGEWLPGDSSADNHGRRLKTELNTRWKAIFRIVPSKIIASYHGITEQPSAKSNARSSPQANSEQTRPPHKVAAAPSSIFFKDYSGRITVTSPLTPLISSI